MRKSKKQASAAPATESRYINREKSWLAFNRRVLAEAANPANPLLERIKFLAIFESNLDEFYMVRVSGLIEQWETGLAELTPDGLSPSEQLKLILKTALPMRREASALFREQIEPALDEAGIRILGYEELSPKKVAELEEFFIRDVFPVCTPLILHPAANPPFISNRSLNLAVRLQGTGAEGKLARVKIPTVLPRCVRLSGRKNDFVLLEDVIAHNLKYLFPSVEVLGAYKFRVMRDADIEIRELEAADLIAAVEEMTRKRRFGAPVRLDMDPTMPEDVKLLLLRILELDESDVYQIDGPLGFEFLWELAALDRSSLKFPPFQPYLNEALAGSKLLFEAIKKNDIFLHHPYDSFRPVEDFVASAARDPNVIGIKQILYRVGTESPIVESLLRAAEEGKQVAVMVELKARFDESNNVVWARALERAGVHISYGFSELKTHSKLCLIVRREPGGIRSYAHIGTGNYNPLTARLYTDFGLFTDDEEITKDIAELFNVLTGFSKQSVYRKLLVAPMNLRDGIIDRIERETAIQRRSGGGRIIFKLNALVDPEVIDALYEASAAGVSIDLLVRGICCLYPERPGLSENIRVSSIVGRFLEHSRAFYFENGGKPELYIGSADLMRRNLDRRIEVLAPVRDPELIRLVKEQVLEVSLKDDVKAWRLGPDGDYSRKPAAKGGKSFESQAWFLQNPTSKLQLDRLNGERSDS